MCRLSPPALALAALLGVGLAPLLWADEQPPPPARQSTHRLLQGERERTYHLLVPADHDPSEPRPLVLALHGGGGSGEGFDAATNGQFAREVRRRRWIVALPEGVANGWNDGRPLQGLRERRREGVDDVAFLSALIDRLHQTHGIDRERVYATGISNGGFMSFRLALDLSEKIAAIAPVTATLQRVHADRSPAHPVGLLLANGTADPLVPYDGGEVRVLGRSRGKTFSTDETLARWLGFNHCPAEHTLTALPDRDPDDGTRSTLALWDSPHHAQVALLRIEGGGHTWPGGTQYLSKALIGPVSRDFDLVPLLFDFFARHRRTLPPPAPSPADPPAPAAPAAPPAPPAGKN